MNLLNTNHAILESEVFKVLKDLDTSKVAGPVGMHPRVLQELREVIRHHLKLSLTTAIHCQLEKLIKENEKMSIWIMLKKRKI